MSHAVGPVHTKTLGLSARCSPDVMPLLSTGLGLYLDYVLVNIMRIVQVGGPI